jgi:hypothetical protein
MSLLVDLPECEADWKSQRIGVGRKIGMDLVGEAARQIPTAHPELVGSTSGRPQPRRHHDGEFHLIVWIAILGVISHHRRVWPPVVRRRQV